MARTALSHAHRLYVFSESIITSFAQANVPYAAQILLLLRIAELLIVQVLAHLVTAQPQSPRC